MNKIINSDCIAGMKELPDGIINCCVTSPPYFGLRDYGHDGQIGLEDTPELFVQKMVEVFREVKRVLKDDGTLWLNLGDTYAANIRQYGKAGKISSNGGTITNMQRKRPVEYKEKDLMGIPWRVAFALQADGWYLRQDIIWHKPNPMPESVTDRCTKSHEYIFLLSKNQRYFYDHEAIKQEGLVTSLKRMERGVSDNHKNINGAPGQPPHSLSKPRHNRKYLESDSNIITSGMANKRSVWTVTTKPFADAHFATFPEDLIVDMIKAGCPEGGLVLDPFMGAGTTALVSRKLNRNYVGFELNAEYIKIAEKRLYNQIGMFL